MACCGGTKVAAPPARDVAKEQADTLLTQMQAHRGEGPFEQTGSLLELEQETRPGYIDLDLQSLERMLGGSAGQRGLLEQYGDIQPVMTELEAKDREGRAAADVNILQRHGRATADAIREASGSADLLNELERQAREELSAGAKLDPAMQREIQQYTRGAQAARGMGHGNPDAFEETMNLGSAAYGRRRERQGFASSVAGQLQAAGGDPMLALLGRSSGAAAMVPGVAGRASGMGQNLGPQMFNPESAYAADAYRGNHEARIASRTANAANSAQMGGGMMNMLGALGGGLLKGAGAAGGIGALFCWVAREVYGEEDSQWKQFRKWMVLKAPLALLRLYREQGEALAERLRNHPEAKVWLRWWMDRKVAEL